MLMTLPGHIALVVVGVLLAQVLLPLAARVEVRTARQWFTVAVAAAGSFATAAHATAAATGTDASGGCLVCCSLLSGLLFGCVVRRVVCGVRVVPRSPTGRTIAFAV
jgi:hypothetical protein